MTNLELTYCESCLENLEDDRFDYRFDSPVCFDCVNEFNLLVPEEEIL